MNQDKPKKQLPPGCFKCEHCGAIVPGDADGCPACSVDDPAQYEY